MSRIEMGRLSNGREMLFWDALASGYDEQLTVREWSVPALVDSFLTELGCSPESVLDLGTGTGNTLDAIFTHTQPRRIVGVDSSIRMLQYAQERYSDEERLTLVNASMPTYLEDATDKFDLVTCFETMHLFPSPEKIIQGAARLLNPGGYFVFTHDLIVEPTLRAQEQVIHPKTGLETTVYRQHPLEIVRMVGQNGLTLVKGFIFDPFPRETKKFLAHMVAVRKLVRN